jgi:hypothetical protein
MTFQLILAGFDGTVDSVSQQAKGLAGGHQQALETDAVARSQSQQLALLGYRRRKGNRKGNAHDESKRRKGARTRRPRQT